MASSLLSGFLRSTLGLKVLMAFTGGVLFGYTVGHVTGNMLIFAGADKINAYSKFLHDSTMLLWGTRVLLLVSVLVHIYASIKLTALKGEARPIAYDSKKPHGSTYASRTMMWSGPIIGLFVIYHILHLTTGTVHPDFHVNPVTHEVDVYRNLVTGFQKPLASGIYIVAMLALGYHLSHGVWSMLQTLGVNRPQWEKCLRTVSIVFAIVVCGGFILVPAAVLLGFVT